MQRYSMAARNYYRVKKLLGAERFRIVSVDMSEITLELRQEELELVLQSGIDVQPAQRAA